MTPFDVHATLCSLELLPRVKTYTPKGQGVIKGSKTTEFLAYLPENDQYLIVVNPLFEFDAVTVELWECYCGSTLRIWNGTFQELPFLIGQARSLALQTEIELAQHSAE